MKDIKFTSGALILFFSLNTFAGVGEIGSGSVGKTEIPSARMAEYKQAAKLALQKANLSCVSHKADIVYQGTLNDVIDHATSATLDTSAQPLLTFSGIGDYKMSLSLTTSADLNTVTSGSFVISELVPEYENQGDLAAPSVSSKKVWVERTILNCSK
ncbi:MAG TPA: hypothetical protein VF412_09345 [Bdellovibrio sp.]|uniref:hypothetical protein n=1 Tax=Bdellovibrio sp. TaxID=28201 RepID=UPI002F10FDAB